jgi:hypothetical protein
VAELAVAAGAAVAAEAAVVGVLADAAALAVVGVVAGAAELAAGVAVAPPLQAAMRGIDASASALAKPTRNTDRRETLVPIRSSFSMLDVSPLSPRVGGTARNNSTRWTAAISKFTAPTE